MNKEDILFYLNELNEELKRLHEHVKLYIYGGAVLSIAYDLRDSTRDIDAQYTNERAVDKAIKKIADKYHLENNWLNSGVDMFSSKNADFQIFKEYSHLTVYVTTLEYMIALKARASRRKDYEDLVHLLSYSGIVEYPSLEKIIHKYYPGELEFTKQKEKVLQAIGDARKK